MLSRLKTGKDDLETTENEIMSLTLNGSKDGLVNGNEDSNQAIKVSKMNLKFPKKLNHFYLLTSKFPDG